MSITEDIQGFFAPMLKEGWFSNLLGPKEIMFQVHVDDLNEFAYVFVFYGNYVDRQELIREFKRNKKRWGVKKFRVREVDDQKDLKWSAKLADKHNERKRRAGRVPHPAWQKAMADLIADRTLTNVAWY